MLLPAFYRTNFVVKMSDRRIELSINDIRERSSVIEEIGAFGSGSVTGIATLKESKAGDLSFLGLAKYAGALADCSASVVFVPEDCEVAPRTNQLFLKVKNPSLSLARACESIAQSLWPKKPGGVHPSAVVADSAEVHETAFIGPLCVIGENSSVGAGAQIHSGTVIDEASTIGADCWLASNVSVARDTKIGDRVRIHSGVVIGADGYGYEFNGSFHEKVPQLGWVEIESDVEIGANTAIDRGRLGPTLIGEGSKIDNHVQIGHNVKIGKHCILCAQVGIAGSTNIEDFVVFGGRAGASGHLTIGKGAKLAGCSAAFNDIAPGSVSGGTPAIPLNAFQRITVVQRKLPDLFKRVQRLESQIGKDG